MKNLKINFPFALMIRIDLLFVLAKMYFFSPKNHNFFGYPKISFSEPPQKSEPLRLIF